MRIHLCRQAETARGERDRSQLVGVLSGAGAGLPWAGAAPPDADSATTGGAGGA
ncbi:MAG: hypothetical protein ACRC50_02610 [Gaiella sp.]